MTTKRDLRVTRGVDRLLVDRQPGGGCLIQVGCRWSVRDPAMDAPGNGDLAFAWNSIHLGPKATRRLAAMLEAMK